MLVTDAVCTDVLCCGVRSGLRGTETLSERARALESALPA